MGSWRFHPQALYDGTHHHLRSGNASRSFESMLHDLGSLQNASEQYQQGINENGQTLMYNPAVQDALSEGRGSSDMTMYAHGQSIQNNAQHRERLAGSLGWTPFEDNYQGLPRQRIANFNDADVKTRTGLIMRTTYQEGNSSTWFNDRLNAQPIAQSPITRSNISNALVQSLFSNMRDGLEPVLCDVYDKSGGQYDPVMLFNFTPEGIAMRSVNERLNRERFTRLPQFPPTTTFKTKASVRVWLSGKDDFCHKQINVRRSTRDAEHVSTLDLLRQILSALKRMKKQELYATELDLKHIVLLGILQVSNASIQLVFAFEA